MAVSAFEHYLAMMDRIILGNSLREWIFASSVAILMFFGLKLIRRLLRRKLPLLAGIGRFDWDKAGEYVLKSTRGSFLLILSAWFATRFLTLPVRVHGLLEKVLALVFVYQCAIWTNFLINFLVEGYATRTLNGDADKAGTLKAASGLGKLVVWVALLLFALDNMGINVTTLIAGLGIGGVAIGLASQKILSDLFSSITIILDKPFVQGDSITVGGDSGTIERIGLKTTRVRSTTGEELNFPNSDLLQSRIRNFRRMHQRRVALCFGVTYHTPADKLAKIPAMVQEIIGSQKGARFDRSHFKQLGDSSLNFETVYWVLTSDYGIYMDIQQEVNLAIFRKFQAEKIEFAYPTQTLYVNQP